MAEPRASLSFDFDGGIDTFEEIADERRALADQVSHLTAQQQATRSLCQAWNVHEVLAHLIMPMQVSVPKFMLAMVLAGGNFDRANERLTRQQAQAPFTEIVEVLRQQADNRFTPPGEGAVAPLIDILVHGLDIRWPLRLPYDIPAERSRKALSALVATKSAPVPKGLLRGLRFEARDIDWAHGDGATVHGKADALLLAIAGRPVALKALGGDGVTILKARMAACTKQMRSDKE